MLRFRGLGWAQRCLTHGDAGWHTLAVQGHTPSVRAQVHGTPTFMAMLSHDIDRSFCLLIGGVVRGLLELRLADSVQWLPA